MDKSYLKQLIREILEEERISCPIKVVRIPQLAVKEEDRLDTGDFNHRVYTKDIFSLQESPNLGCGIMELERTTFPWTLQYDEIDYVIEGSLTIYYENQAITAGQGELLLIPKGSHILFSASERVRFLYVTYPADWQNQK